MQGPGAIIGGGPAAVPRKTRRKLMTFDRLKIGAILLAILGFSIVKEQSDFPMDGWGSAARNQLVSKQWVLWLIGLEVLRQIHYLVSEKSADYNHFWNHRIWGAWNRFWSRRNPWFRFRMARMFKRAVFFVIAAFVLSALWRLSLVDTVTQAPSRILRIMFSSEQRLPFIFSVLLTLGFAVGQFVAIFWFMSRGGVETFLPDEVSTRFNDVWGQDRVLDKVKENIAFLDKPEEIEAKGGHVPSGILLWGPPGTGKTLIAKAVAGETGRPYVFVDPGAFQAMFFGVGILKVKALFRKLRKLALRHGGVIVFFDEADSLGNRGTAVAGASTGHEHDHSVLGHRCNGDHYVSASSVALNRATRPGSGPSQTSATADASHGGIKNVVMTGMNGGGMGTLQALLTEISGLEKPIGMFSRNLRKFFGLPAKKPPKYRILMMMATNTPDVLDPALLRPGRIDRKYQVGYPSLVGRTDTYRNYLKRVSNDITEQQVERIALMHPRGTGAEIQDIVNEALIVAMRANRSLVTWPDLLKAKAFKTHGMPDDVHPVALERHAVALHEASHAVAMMRLKKRETIDVATIEPRGPVGGFVAPVPLEEPGFPWKKLNEEEVMTYLASLAGERLFYDGDNSVGVGGDMAASTSMVSRMIGMAAMGDTLASHSVLFATDSDPTRAVFNTQVEAKLQELYVRTQVLIADNRRWVMAIAHALEEHKTISGEDVHAILDGTKGPIVDGAWYHTDGFVMAYERYHADALYAHQNQTKLATPLPTPGNVFMMESPPVAPVGAIPAAGLPPLGLPPAPGSPNPEPPSAWS
jgi:cell division protease FtsH